MDNKDADVMQLFEVLASTIFGSSVSSVIGPYLLIIFAAITGAAWSLGRRESKSKFDSLFYFLRVVFMAILITVTIARVMAGYWDGVEMEWLIAPVALVVGLIGDDWMKVFGWFANAARKLGNKILKKKMEEE